MYPSLPHHIIIDNTIEFLALNNISPDTSSKIISLVKPSIQYNIFSFNSNFYRLTKGSPMGSPLSSPLAEIVMRKIDKTITNLLPTDIIIWQRYTDDIFCISNSTKIDTIFTQLKSIHNDIDFTIETENNNFLPFLDVFILKTQNQYTTKIYHKPNSTPDYIHFSSYCPLSHKINTERWNSGSLWVACGEKPQGRATGARVGEPRREEARCRKEPEGFAGRNRPEAAGTPGEVRRNKAPNGREIASVRKGKRREMASVRKGKRREIASVGKGK
ncbi:hypothetical protein LAZ67_5002448 [Cordylochernes scorpioides]|uniref:Reverse transcriptase domain-containing protein n=1 Tax=Cordylochernes scorpioides TaxID=51811 RepID=A0ABY6KH30_9ARAC|nr:hypothetical protein LAZ67_5002448 [Cordylochernes scorpioides]